MLKTEQNIDPLSSYREKIHDKYFSPKSRIETSPFSYYYHKNSLKKIPKTQFLPSQPKKSNFTLKLPGIAFKKIVISGSKLKVASKLPTETIRKFSATKKTIPLNLLNEKEETKRKASKAINEFYPKQENNRSRSPTLSRSYSLTKSSSFSKSPRARSPTRNDSSSKDLSSFIKNPKYFGNKNAQNKAKDFLDIYMNSFIESPNNKSFSSNKKVELKTTPINDTGFQITPIRVEIDPEICAVKTAELRKKKNNDYNFMKVLLHYWKFENKEEEPKNRPKKQPKVMIWNRKINFKSLRQNLKQLLNFLSCVKLNLNEVIFI